MNKTKLIITFSLILIMAVLAMPAAAADEAPDSQAAQLTIEMLVGAVGVVLSLAFSYAPKLSTWYAGLKSLHQRLIMIGLLAVAAVASYGLACAGLAPWLGYELECSEGGILYLIALFFNGAIPNYVTYKMSEPTAKVAMIKAARKK